MKEGLEYRKKLIDLIDEINMLISDSAFFPEHDGQYFLFEDSELDENGTITCVFSMHHNGKKLVRSIVTGNSNDSHLYCKFYIIVQRMLFFSEDSFLPIFPSVSLKTFAKRGLKDIKQVNN